ncbi:hypothetical protein CspeluHIS016_0601440 [Cutaneotrichosporon spelunceum]|uniref:Elongation factor 1-gamma n=1 Tax=Cutaneotrichosporon spelunceum TaxID=1672016 RepID=A0AAD3YE73_9TREE|nr:hypothetical protein CspeluHIS016_0601440 [Cutaneotrichosporon spelunceum]
MWLVKARGSVNGQSEFTFVLEQRRIYLVGRDKAADIRFGDRAVRPKEGVLQVGDWNPADVRTPPTLSWQAEPKKNGTFPPTKALSQRLPSATYCKGDYDVGELDGEESYDFAPTGNGISIVTGADFYAEWQDLQIAYDGFKNETEEFKDGLRKHCVSWTTKTDANTDVVVAEEYSNASNPSLAVCYGVPVVTPGWLSILSNRLRVCWKKSADWEDSFTMPDVDGFVPKMKEGLPTHRADPGSWRIDPSNRTLFERFYVVGLMGPKKQLKDSVYLSAMGATYRELEILSSPPKTGSDFLERLAPIRASAEAEGREIIIAYLPSLKKDLEAKGVNFDAIVTSPSSRANIYLGGVGPLVWGVVRDGNVEEYFRRKTGGRPEQSAVEAMSTSEATHEEPAPPPEPEPAEPVSSQPAPQTRRLTRRAGATSRSASRATSAQPTVIPSTYPDPETVVPERTRTPPTEEPIPSKPAVKKPLRRRAGRAKVDVDDDMDMSEATQAGPSQPPQSFAADTQFSSGVSGTQLFPEMGISHPVLDPFAAATQADSMVPLPAARPGARRLKRRAGATQASSAVDDFDTTIHYEEEVKKQQKAREIRDLYEETKRETESLNPQPTKRQRTRRPLPESVEELIEIDEEDFVSKAIRTRLKRGVSAKATPQSAKEMPENIREETPEEIEVHGQTEVRPAKNTSKSEVTNTSKGPSEVGSKHVTPEDAPMPLSQVDKDEAFLQAIRKSKKAGLDDMDREFNAMHIRKAAQQKRDVDYAIVRDFNDDLRGNFIEIVRKDLFRADPPRVLPPPADDGRPNFKKFKKKNVTRRQPLQVMLAVSTQAAEMGGEPYWETEAAGPQRGTQKKSQGTQSKMQSQRVAMLEEEDDAPLLPRSKRRTLTQIQEEEGAEEDFIPVASTRRSGVTPLSQSQAEPVPRRRNTRAESAISERSNSSTPAPPPVQPRTRRGTQASRSVVLDDDSDDEPVFATARSTTRTRGARSGGVPNTVPASGLSTMQFDDDVPSSTRATAGSTRASARRKLLVEDDGDDIATTTFSFHQNLKMAPIGKLYGFSGNSRFRRALAVATYAGLDVETDPNFTMKDGAWKTPEFLNKFPLGYLPAFEGADGLNLQESGAIADYFASLAPNCDIVPADKNAAAEVREWQYFADQEIMIKTGVIMRMLNNRLPYNKPVFEGLLAEIMGRLEILDKILLKKTYIVGERLSIADIFIATSLTNAFTAVVDASLRAKIPNVVRYTNTVIRHPKISKVFGTVEFIEKMPSFQAPAKAPKKEKAPKEEKPKAEKKEKKPKEKEPEDDDIDLAPPAPKPQRNPLDDLPKSSFNLEEWKRQYSNLDTRGANSSLEWFYKNFDWEGFSIWRMDFKYNDELTMTFMSNNQIGGFFTRLEATRKYAFGSTGVLGENNNSIITGALIVRGQDVYPIVDAAPDYESYSFTKLDVQNKPEDKEFFEGALAWDLKIDGKEFADGKVLK